MIQTITKLSRYFAVSRFLVQAARKYPLVGHLRFSTVYFRSSNLPATELDSMTARVTHGLLTEPKLGKLTSRVHGLSSSAIDDYVRREANLAVPVHAEVQLLFHYEQKSCELPPRIMCSSKQACYLCSLFFRIHGRFSTPNSHGRLYEKWALPDVVKNISKADGQFLARLDTFVSAIENAILRASQSTRKCFPDPCECMIFRSAVCSESHHSTLSVQKFPVNPRSGPCQDSQSASVDVTSIADECTHPLHREHIHQMQK